MAAAVTTLPVPPASPGLIWRPWTMDDVPALIRHNHRVHEAERLEHVSGAEFYRWLASQEGFDPTSDTLAAFDSTGEAHAEAGVWAQVTDQGARAFIGAEVAPPNTGLRPWLLTWVEARARQRLATADPTKDRVIRAGVEEHRSQLRSELLAAGFELKRSFATMRRSLTGLPTAPPLPADVTVVEWSPEWDERFRLANNESFADHWGTFPMSPHAWATAYRESEIFRGDLSFAAVSGDTVVSFCTVEVEEEENARTGHHDMYIHRVGTLRSHRRLRLASHLMVRSMEAALAAGLERAVLDVDESSHTNAGQVYLRLGFEVTERSMHYLKTM
jgi:mycothiol synthase